jgi:hypothetical protein
MTKKHYIVEWLAKGIRLYPQGKWCKYDETPNRDNVKEFIKEMMSKNIGPNEIRVRVVTTTEEVFSCCEFGTRKDLK